MELYFRCLTVCDMCDQDSISRSHVLRLTNQREFLRQQRSIPVLHHGDFSTLLVHLESLFTVYLSMGRGRNRFFNSCAKG